MIHRSAKKIEWKKISVFLNVLCENKVISVFMIFTAISLRNIQIPFSLARIEERRLNFTISITRRQTLLHQVLTFALKMEKRAKTVKSFVNFTLSLPHGDVEMDESWDTHTKKMPIDKIEVRENQAFKMLRT